MASDKDNVGERVWGQYTLANDCVVRIMVTGTLDVDALLAVLRAQQGSGKQIGRPAGKAPRMAAVS